MSYTNESDGSLINCLEIQNETIQEYEEAIQEAFAEGDTEDHPLVKEWRLLQTIAREHLQAIAEEQAFRDEQQERRDAGCRLVQCRETAAWEWRG